MNQPDNYAAIIRKIQTTKPHLVQNFINFKECLERLVPLDNRHRICLLKLTYACEYVYIRADRLFPLLLARGEFTVFCGIFYTLSLSGYHYARTLLEAYPRLRFPLALIAQDMQTLVQAAAVLPGKGVQVLTICLKYETEELCRFMLRQMGVLARYAPGIMNDCASLIYGELGGCPTRVLMQWMARGIDLITSNRVEEGVKFLLLESGTSRQMLGMNHVVLDDFRNILRIYSASLAGRELNINSQDLSMFGFKAPYTDGATLFLPPAVGFFKNPEQNRRVYTVLAALQAAALSLGTFTLELRSLPFRIAMRERYGTLLPEILYNVKKQYAGIARSVKERRDGEVEITFAHNRKLLVLNTEHEKLFYSFPTPDFARELFTLVENTRIENRLAPVYPGLNQDFLLLNTYLWEKRQPLLPRTGDKRITGFFLSLETLIQYSLLRKTKTEITDNSLQELTRSLTGAFEAILTPGATVEDTAAVMFNLYNIFFDNFPVEKICKQYALVDTFREIFKPELYPEVVSAVCPELMQSGKPAFEPAEAAEEEAAREIDFSSFRDVNSRTNELRQAIADGAVKVFKYPEYDYLKNSYLSHHCTLFETSLPALPNDYCERTLAQYKMVYKKTKKRFLHMKPDEMELSRRWYSGTDIHITDAVDYCMSLLRGESPDEKIYYRKILNRRDLTVAILVDASSSTDSAIGGSTILNIEKDSLVILASALAAIDDSFAIFSFYSLGPGNVFINIVKDFQEAWNQNTRQRIAYVKAYASNRDGCAIRHVTARLLKEQERIKLLLLLSDGIPADLHYGSGSSSETSRYAIEDTRKAIQEARKQGILPYCLTIDRSAKSYIAHLYGDYHYAVLADVTRLPEKLAQLYLRLTR